MGTLFHFGRVWSASMLIQKGFGVFAARTLKRKAQGNLDIPFWFRSNSNSSNKTSATVTVTTTCRTNNKSNGGSPRNKK
eukprot:1788084-Amphidinium_carterae.1